MIEKIPIGSVQKNGLYEAARYCWRGNLNRARRADYVLGTKGRITVDIVIKLSSYDYIKKEIYNQEKETYKKVFGVNTTELLLKVKKWKMIKNICIKPYLRNIYRDKIRLDTRIYEDAMPAKKLFKLIMG